MLEQLRENWQRIKEEIRKDYDLTGPSYKTWIEPVKLNNVNGNIVELYSSDSQYDDFGVRYFNNKYALFFEMKIEEITGLKCEVRFVEKD